MVLTIYYRMHQTPPPLPAGTHVPRQRTPRRQWSLGGAEAVYGGALHTSPPTEDSNYGGGDGGEGPLQGPGAGEVWGWFRLG